MSQLIRERREYIVASLCCGAGGQTLGALRAAPVVDGVLATFRSVGGLDSDPEACASFERLTKSKAYLVDLRDEVQYRAMEGSEPPADWQEMTPQDLLELIPECPDMVITSAPCRGLTKLNQHRAQLDYYRALNRLTERTLYLALTGWGYLGGKKPRIILIENVPGLAGKNGRELLANIRGMLTSEGYRVGVKVYDCGEIAGMAQSRVRCLIYAVHDTSTPSSLFCMQNRGLKGVGEVLSDLPLPLRVPGHAHSLPSIQEKTQLRLALVPAGKDWRALKELEIEDGHVVGWSRHEVDFSSVPCPAPPVTEHGSHQPYGVLSPSDTAHTITARFGPGAGYYSLADERIADPNLPSGAFRSVLGVAAGHEAIGAITAAGRPYNGKLSVADERIPDPSLASVAQNHAYRVTLWSEPSGAVTTGGSPRSGGRMIQELRDTTQAPISPKVYVIAPDDLGDRLSDPRATFMKREGPRKHFDAAGFYGVMTSEETSGTVTTQPKVDAGRWAWAAPPEWLAGLELDEGVSPLDVYVRADVDDEGQLRLAEHRPITVLEAGVLQGFTVEDVLGMEGSITSLRRQIGNAVPPEAMIVLAELALETLVKSDKGVGWTLDAREVWADPRRQALMQARRDLLGALLPQGAQGLDGF